MSDHALSAPTRPKPVFNYHLGEAIQLARWRIDLQDGPSTTEPLRRHRPPHLQPPRPDEVRVPRQPGGDYTNIELSYDGIEGLTLADDGSLHITTALGGIVDENLYIYQTIDGQQIEVAGEFTLIDDDTYTFTVMGPVRPHARTRDRPEHHLGLLPGRVDL